MPQRAASPTCACLCALQMLRRAANPACACLCACLCCRGQQATHVHARVHICAAEGSEPHTCMIIFLLPRAANPTCTCSCAPECCKGQQTLHVHVYVHCRCRRGQRTPNLHVRMHCRCCRGQRTPHVYDHVGVCAAEGSKSHMYVFMCIAGAAEGGEPHSLEQHSSKLASQLAHLSSLLDRKGAINLQAFGASAFVPLMKSTLSYEVREAQLRALNATPAKVSYKLVTGPLLSVLEAWLLEGDADQQHKFVR
ncbi:hypothetical protein DUNSADRAFT_7290 [Dunaliella salina]|uniref:Uncharacterized protein n=1 Tax=Dunaliella salina TaxID=3046 RepID=A0ABQ7GLM4_DUNSA|nr:hypothetical protein DUNSADRAFT_7290 [Dunaliella salina]|eukprot:KAF5835506.1 hypothetical protein DUNSADRAFT_7290 [Dunaliella salina]